MSYYHNTDDEIENVNMINYIEKEPSLIEYYKEDIKNGLKVVSKSTMVLVSEIIHVMPTLVRLYSYYKFIKIFV
jgi:hypothetical protein